MFNYIFWNKNVYFVSQSLNCLLFFVNYWISIFINFCWWHHWWFESIFNPKIFRIIWMTTIFWLHGIEMSCFDRWLTVTPIPPIIIFNGNGSIVFIFVEICLVTKITCRDFIRYSTNSFYWFMITINKYLNLNLETIIY